MREKNETAEAIWIVLKRIAKWILIICVSIVCLVALFAVYVDHKDSQERKERALKEDKVIVKAAFSKNLCPPKFPYAYVIRNTGDTTVDKVDFSVEIKRKGYSNPLNSYTNLEDDKILKPGETRQMCFSAEKKDYSGPLTDADVEIEIVYKSVTFSESSN